MIGEPQEDTNIWETSLSIVTVLSTLALFATILSSISLVLEDMKQQNKAYKKDKEVLNRFFANKQGCLLQEEIKLRLTSYLKYLYIGHQEMKQSNDLQQVLQKFPSSLQESVKQQRYTALIQKFDLLTKNFSFQAITSLTNHMEEQYFMPNQIIYFQNDYLEPRLYLVLKGQVNIEFQTSQIIKKKLFIQDSNIRIVNQGECFGIENFFSDREPQFTAKSMQFTTILSIKRKDFIKIIKNYNHDFQKFNSFKDQIRFYDLSARIYNQCEICEQFNNHSSRKCNLIQHNPYQLPILQKFIRSQKHYQSIRYLRFRNKKFNRQQMKQGVKYILRNDYDKDLNDRKFEIQLYVEEMFAELYLQEVDQNDMNISDFTPTESNTSDIEDLTSSSSEFLQQLNEESNESSQNSDNDLSILIKSPIKQDKKNNIEKENIISDNNIQNFNHLNQSQNMMDSQNRSGMYKKSKFRTKSIESKQIDFLEDPNAQPKLFMTKSMQGIQNSKIVSSFNNIQNQSFEDKKFNKIIQNDSLDSSAFQMQYNQTEEIRQSINRIQSINYKNNQLTVKNIQQIQNSRNKIQKNSKLIVNKQNKVQKNKSSKCILMTEESNASSQSEFKNTKNQNIQKNKIINCKADKNQKKIQIKENPKTLAIKKDNLSYGQMLRKQSIQQNRMLIKRNSVIEQLQFFKSNPLLQKRVSLNNQQDYNITDQSQEESNSFQKKQFSTLNSNSFPFKQVEKNFQKQKTLLNTNEFGFLTQETDENTKQKRQMLDVINHFNNPIEHEKQVTENLQQQNVMFSKHFLTHHQNQNEQINKKLWDVDIDSMEQFVSYFSHNNYPAVLSRLLKLQIINEQKKQVEQLNNVEKQLEDLGEINGNNNHHQHQIVQLHDRKTIHHHQQHKNLKQEDILTSQSSADNNQDNLRTQQKSLLYYNQQKILQSSFNSQQSIASHNVYIENE